MPARWARGIIARRGGRYVGGTTRTEKAWPADDPARAPLAFEGWLRWKLHYMLKCAPACLEGELAMQGWGNTAWGQSCRVFGKRAGAWQHRGRRRIK
jgi:hypothetical protein